MLLIEAIKAFSDNYIWLLHNHQQAWLVDPGESAPVFDALDEKKLKLDGVLITHHHHDHVGALTELAAEHPELNIIGPANSHPAVKQTVKDGAKVCILDQYEAEVVAIPGHTLDHLYYFFRTEKALFCGDTLFSGGCGRVFEGTMPMMFNSLQKIASLPPDTRVFCAHEYTQANLQFAVAVEPDNQALQERIKQVEHLRGMDQPSIPTQLSEELQFNPFLRCQSPSILKTLNSQNKLPTSEQEKQDWQVFQALREWKDCY